jgi:hypothetical protein
MIKNSNFKRKYYLNVVYYFMLIYTQISRLMQIYSNLDFLDVSD